VVIAKVAAACNISPRVLLVILQKEQGLVTTTGGASLTATRYQKAMGYACPDTAACDTKYYGFENQVYFSARQFQRYAAAPASFGYRAGRTSSIQYHPNAGCGTSSVYIQNQATAGLYIYTPYRPNPSALAAGYGTGDSCSAYGNRNFWLYFTDWFGSTQNNGESAWQPIGRLDSVVAESGDRIRVEGWAIDPDTADPIAVHLYVDGAYSGAYPVDVNRPDIAATLPAYGPRHGFSIPLGVSQGSHYVCAYAINVGGPAPNPSLGCATVDTRGLPYGNVEAMEVDEGQALIAGWTIDPDASTPVDVHVYVNGALAAYGPANLSRPDVGAAHPGAGSARGFTFRAGLQPGDNQVCVYAINVPTPAWNPTLLCRSLRLDINPIGWLETATGASSSVTVTGWALDPETRSAIDVHAFVDGVDTTTYSAGDRRTDIAAAYPRPGGQHGFSFSVPAAPGDRQVCVRARNVKQGPFDVLIGCRTVNVGVAPVGHLDAVSINAFQATVDGWALDLDTANPVDVQIWVDGRNTALVSASADRPDVGAVFPASGPAHGFRSTLTLPSGQHLVCVVAVNVLGGPGNSGLGCQTVTVAGGSLPWGRLDSVRAEGAILRASGWALDPDAPGSPLTVQFTLNGGWGGLVTADESRPDVGAYHAGVGPSHGFTGSWVPGPGRYTVCAYGINRVYGNADTLLGCTAVTLP
jgi:hypothetical protein